MEDIRKDSWSPIPATLRVSMRIVVDH